MVKIIFIEKNEIQKHQLILNKLIFVQFINI